MDLRRLDQGGDITELSLHVEFEKMENILNAKNELKELADVQFSFVENY